MLYSAVDSTKLTSWDNAASEGGCAPADAQPGAPRTYGVAAWLRVDGEAERVSEKWFTEMDAPVRKALLKELGLPARKQLVYRRSDAATAVADFRILSVWRDCCALELRLADGTVPTLPVNSMRFAEINK